MSLKHSGSQTKRRLLAAFVAEVLLLQTMMPAHGQVLQTPGIYIEPPNPNIMFTLDDSGSMQADALPDFDKFLSPTSYDYSGLPASNASTVFYYNSGATNRNRYAYPNMWGNGSGYRALRYYQSSDPAARYMRSSAGNPLYYDRRVTYSPWRTAANDNIRSANATPTSVNVHTSNPFDNTQTVINLTQRVNVSAGTADDETRNYWPATYFIYDDPANPLPLANPATALNRPYTAINSAGRRVWTKVEIKPSVTTYARHVNPATGAVDDGRTDCAAATHCTYTEELRNFSNWLQFYRNRMLMAKGGVSEAFSEQRTNLRVGFGTINTVGAVRRPVAPFSGTNRQNFFSSLYGATYGTNVLTPLRRAADDVGKYFQGTSSVGNPWHEAHASVAPSQSHSCRKSFHILSTDGFWNDAAATSPANGNNDNFASSPQGQTPPAYEGNARYTYSDTNPAGTLAARFSLNPFRDTASNTLSDVAAYYWQTDLQGGAGSSHGLKNDVASSSRDPAYWQHLTTFTVGLGITGSGQARPADANLSMTNANGEYVVSTNSGYVPPSSPFYPYRGKPWLSDSNLRELLVAHKTPMAWPTPTADSPATGDDLVHAAMVSRGRYLSATNPSQLATGLSAALSEATNQNSAFASVGISNTNSLATSSRLYQAIFNPYGWTGRVYAFGVNRAVTDTTPANALWEASRAMPAPNARNIFTWNPSAAPARGSMFTWSGLNSAQQAALGPASGAGSSVAERQAVLEYLRGSPAREFQNGGPLRDRVRETATSGVLGDIVGGSPIKGPLTGGRYTDLPNTPQTMATARTTYETFRAADPSGSNSPIRTMVNTLFFGANDGMLHALNTIDVPTHPEYNLAAPGAERFAFVPNSVFSVPNTYYNGTTGTVKKLYEMSRPDYAHLFTVNGPPQIADAYIHPTIGNSTGWKSVLLGTTGAGARSLFALDVTNPRVGTGATDFNASKVLWEFSESQSPDMGHVPGYANVGLMKDGTWVAIVGNGYDSSSGQAKLFLIELETGNVIWEQAVGPANSGNGLSQPNFVLKDRQVVAIYAGDLHGNMWKFDVNSADRNEWRVAFNGQPLFTTAAGQPITVMPELEYYPASPAQENIIVVFGTGKLFHQADLASGGQQAIYGIWDVAPTPVTSRNQLVQQTLTPGPNGSFRTSENDVTAGTHRGWFINLLQGEQVYVDPYIPAPGQNVPVFVVANRTSNDPCGGDRGARVFALNSRNGQTPRFSVFDVNRDGDINSADGRNNVISYSGVVISSLAFLVPGSAASEAITTAEAGGRGRTGARPGGLEYGVGSTQCISSAKIVGGKSDTGLVQEDAKLGECLGRVSWRQIK
jgi:type IV pilus assembly protein PilY1